MVTRIYTKISLDGVGGSHDLLERYRDYLVDALIRDYPHATIEVETTTRESGELPLVIEAEEWTEERDVQDLLSATWDEFCRQA